MTSHFNVHEHTIPTAHIREYPRALVDDQEDVLQLAIKQYTPKESRGRSQQSVTVIGAHANGFPKVLSSGLIHIALADVSSGVVRAFVG